MTVRTMQIVAHTDIASASPTSPTLRNSVSVSLDISDYTAKEVNKCASRYASYRVYYERNECIGVFQL